NNDPGAVIGEEADQGGPIDRGHAQKLDPENDVAIAVGAALPGDVTGRADAPLADAEGELELELGAALGRLLGRWQRREADAAGADVGAPATPQPAGHDRGEQRNSRLVPLGPQVAGGRRVSVDHTVVTSRSPHGPRLGAPPDETLSTKRARKRK